MNKKGFEKSIGVVVTIVVLLIVALALITLVLQNTERTNEHMMTAEEEASCNIWKQSACISENEGVKTHPTIEGCEIDCGSA